MLTVSGGEGDLVIPKKISFGDVGIPEGGWGLHKPLRGPLAYIVPPNPPTLCRRRPGFGQLRPPRPQLRVGWGAPKPPAPPRAMSVCTPRSRSNPPKTLGAQKSEPRNRHRHRSPVLASMTVVIRLSTGPAREAGREAARTGHRHIAASAVSPHCRIHHTAIPTRRSISLFRHTANPPHRTTSLFRHTANQPHRHSLFIRKSPGTADSLFTGKSSAAADSPLYHQIGRFPALAPNRPTRSSRARHGWGSPRATRRPGHDLSTTAAPLENWVGGHLIPVRRFNWPPPAAIASPHRSATGMTAPIGSTVVGRSATGAVE
jgi:hypothetical protein